jgi:hypothetical protein
VLNLVYSIFAHNKRNNFQQKQVYLDDMAEKNNNASEDGFLQKGNFTTSQKSRNLRAYFFKINFFITNLVVFDIPLNSRWQEVRLVD